LGVLRFGWLPLALLLVAAAQAAPVSAPDPSTPVSVTYAGTFDLANTIVPQGAAHSYTFHVEWAYTWSGSWGDLFNTGGPVAAQTSFVGDEITGNMHAVWRANAGAPLLSCTLKILPVMGDYPDFLARFSTTAGTLRISQLESPTMSYGQFSSTHNPMCGGGPTIDMFGAPPSWNPLGPGSLTVPLSGGVTPFDRTWSWTYRFSKEFRRVYTSALHSKLTVSFS
jgi:hypothetical protein